MVFSVRYSVFSKCVNWVMGVETNSEYRILITEY